MAALLSVFIENNMSYGVDYITYSSRREHLIHGRTALTVRETAKLIWDEGERTSSPQWQRKCFLCVSGEGAV